MSAQENLDAAQTGGLVGGDDEIGDPLAERVARAFHESYERLAPEHGYSTREWSAKPWEQVPLQNRRLMTAVVRELIEAGWVNAPDVRQG